MQAAEQLAGPVPTRRRFRQLSVFCATAFLVCQVVGNAWAGPAAASGPDVAAEPKDVRAWLMRMQEAAGKHNFQGTFVVSAGGAVSSARIAHFCVGPNQFERVELLDGQARKVYRHNDWVHTFWPDSKLALVEQRSKTSSFPTLPQAGEDRITEFYDVRHQGMDRVAGHDATVLWMKPRDGYRFGYRLWADKASGLLLRSDVVNDKGELLESSAFSDVDIGVKPQPELVLGPMKKLDGYRVQRPVLTPTQLEDEGWVLRKPVPGFQQLSCVRRPLEAAAPPESGRASAEAVQTVFSDGLTYVSVFIEPYQPQRHTRAMLTAIGATHTLMRRQGDHWITVVGDVPASTLRAFAQALDRK